MQSSFLYYLISGFLWSYDLYEATISSLVKTEKDFAKHSIQVSTKEAFLKYLAPNAILFEPSGPVNGYQKWQNTVNDEAVLAWSPLFADLSTGSDLGYTTGWYTQKNDRKSTKIDEYGHFVTVWEKQPSGEWKVAVDIGISHPPSGIIPMFQAAPKSTFTGKVDPENAKDDLMSWETHFCKLQNEKGQSIFENYLAPQARLYREERSPYITSEDIKKAISDAKFSVNYTPLDGDISVSGDLGYVYGKTEVQLAKESKSGNYLRIWKKNAAGTWQVMVDLVNY